MNEAVFLRSCTARVRHRRRTGLSCCRRQKRPTDAAVRSIAGRQTKFCLESGGLGFATPGGRFRFEAVCPTLGSIIHSERATSLGAAVIEEGCIEVGRHQRTTVPGLYAAGDVVLGHDQISHATGEAGVAATAIWNDLAALHPRLR